MPSWEFSSVFTSGCSGPLVPAESLKIHTLAWCYSLCVVCENAMVRVHDPLV